MGALAGQITLEGSAASLVVGTSATTIEEKVEYLLRRDQDAQQKANEFAERLARLEAESAQRLGELREQMEPHVARELTKAAEDYRPLRIAGTFALFFGLVCVTVATLLA